MIFLYWVKSPTFGTNKSSNSDHSIFHNFFLLLIVSLIQKSTTFESVKQIGLLSVSSASKALVMLMRRFDNNTVDNNSIREEYLSLLLDRVLFSLL